MERVVLDGGYGDPMGRHKQNKTRRVRREPTMLDRAVADYHCPSGCHTEVSASYRGEMILLDVRHDDDDCPTLLAQGDQVVARPRQDTEPV